MVLPPTPRPELLAPNSSGSLPPLMRRSCQYNGLEPASSETIDSSLSCQGPASRATTENPKEARRWASTPPPAPLPMMQKSTSSEGRYSRMSVSSTQFGERWTCSFIAEPRVLPRVRGHRGSGQHSLGGTPDHRSRSHPRHTD